ncbi:MAG: hypothetical protein JRJ49_01915 [Deltaproteobacteria bacterium]|nr:hypothetical protein [Deltaproteobacteria bacterium]
MEINFEEQKNNDKIITNDFNLLLQDGNIGFYTKCEVIEIFGFNNKNKNPFNIFTLIIFEDTKQENIKEYLTNGLNKLDKFSTIKWGIQRRVIDIKTAITLFNNLIKSSLFQIDDNDDKLEVGNLTFLEKQYIKPYEDIKPNASQLNYILKNNFNNGSYIIEGFDEYKTNTKFLLDNPVTLNDFSEKVGEIIPIKIGNLSDRLGNIIFQFPINLFKLAISSMDTPKRYDEGFKLDLMFHNKLKKKPKLQVIAYNIHNIVDESISDFIIKDIEGAADIEIPTTHLFYQIINKKNRLIVYNKDNFAILQKADVNIYMSSPQDRVFYLNNDIIKIGVTSLEQIQINRNLLNYAEKKEYISWISDRKYEQDLKQLEKERSFIQYFGKKDEDKKALNNIRELIIKYGDNGVYLWDPYLSAIDVKNTLYYSPRSYIELKAITGLKQNKSKKQTIKDMQEEFEKDDKKYLLLNLEVRGKIDNNRYDFHDRFLIFPQEQPKVWALGTSVNQLGKSHHILQQVKNSQHILNAFNKLWDDLKSEECLVWKSI